jgi:hypothetical protein
MTGNEKRMMLTLKRRLENSVTMIANLLSTEDMDDIQVNDHSTPMDIAPIPPKKIAKVKKKHFEMWDMEAARALSACIARNFPDAPATKENALETWADCFRMMRKIDEISENDIIKTLMWSQQDDFWKGNILSASKFRKQYTTLYARSKTVDRRKENVIL